MIEALKFIMEDFLQISNFDKIEQESEAIEILSSDMVEILLNSAVYYQKKYEGNLDPMQEVFPVDYELPIKPKSSPLK